MRGRQVFMDSLVAHGVDAIFGNPGTTENPLLDSLIDYPQIPYYVALHEGVAVGAASFYAQATGKTGIVNLHVAPGLGNGIGMIYGALKARSPMIVTAGQQDTRLRLNEPLLSHDLVAMAAPVTKWSAEPRSADEIGPMMHRAFKIANDPPTGPVFIALPVNVMEQATEIAAVASTALRREAAASEQGIAELVDLLLRSAAPAIVVGDDVARAGAVDLLVEFAELTGAPVWHEALRAQVSFPNRHPNNQGRIPFETANVNRTLAPHDVVVLIGGNFFEELWYDAGPIISEATQVVQIEASHERLAFAHRLDIGLVADLTRALTQLTKALSDKATDTFRAGAKARNDAFTKARDKAREASNARLQSLWDGDPMSPTRALHEISQALPDDVVIVDESITASLEVADQFDFARPGDYYGGRGGGIGQAMAGVIGTKVAYPNRPVVALSGDGSTMYSIQALWSAAHHDLPIIFIILSNREYRVLKHNLDIYRQRFDAQSNRPYPHMDLTKPVLGFVDMARGMGVEAAAVTDPSELGDVVSAALASGKPYLIDVVISGKPQ